MNLEKNERNSNPFPPLEKKSGGSSRPKGANRAFLGSLLVHGVLVLWALSKVLLVDAPPVEHRKPMLVTAEMQNQELSDEPEEIPESADPPPETSEVEPPPSKVIAEPVEPAPWLRPQKSIDSQRLAPIPDGKSMTDAEKSEVYRKPQPKTPTKEPSEVVAKKPQETPSKPAKKPAKKPAGAPLVGAKKKRGLCPSPRYPRRALRRKLEGRVTFLVDIGVDGRVLNLVLEKSSGHDILDRAARDAIKTWQFAPATRGNQTVRDRVRVPITFTIPKRS